MWFARLPNVAQGAIGPNGSPDHSKSVGATGGVYKEQGRNQHKMLTCAYETFLVGVPQLQETIP